MNMDEKLDKIQNLLANDIIDRLEKVYLDTNGIKNLTEAYMTLYQANISTKWDQNHKEDN